jgi:hypothetical protein
MVLPQYHCRFDNFFETVRHSRPDGSVLLAWQQLSGLTAMMQTPSMEHHDEVPQPSQHMQFRNDPVAHSQESGNTISFGDITGTLIFFDQPVQNFYNICLSQKLMRE